MATAGDELFELFKEVPDASIDFIQFGPSVAESAGVAEELLEYMKNNPGMDTSDILEWIDDKAGWDYPVTCNGD